MKIALHSMAALLAVTSSAALAQSDTDVAGPFPVTGNVPALCSGGTLSGGDGVFDVGVLIDTSTGFLLPTLTAPPKTLTGAFCSARSTISVEATPMTSQNFTGTPPSGFSRAVNFTASASGWTVTPATFDTGAAANPGATQQRDAAFTGDIVVAVSDFTTAGGNALRMVADPAYEGAVTVTLAVAE